MASVVATAGTVGRRVGANRRGGAFGGLAVRRPRAHTITLDWD